MKRTVLFRKYEIECLFEWLSPQRLFCACGGCCLTCFDCEYSVVKNFSELLKANS